VTPRPAIVLAALCLLLAVPTAATAAKGMEVGVQDDAVLLYGLYGNAASALGLSQQLNASRIRVNVAWNYVVGSAARKRKAPKRIRYNWSGFDGLIRYAGEHGIKIQMALTGPAPAWATANHRVGPVKPKASAFKAFATAAAVHFRGRVDRYSIWNEPNYVSWLSPLASGPRVYRALYLAGYSAIKRADPGAQVLIGETSPYALKGRSTAPLAFLRGVTCANARYRKARSCGTLKTDGYAHHPYDFRHAPTFRYPGKDNVTLSGLSRLTSALTKLRSARLLTTSTGGVPDVYLTEYGFFASGKFRVSASKQGTYLVKAFTVALKNPHVREMVQYQLLRPKGTSRFFDTSIASLGATPTAAYKKLAAWTRKEAAAGQIAVPAIPSGGGSTGSGGGAPSGSGGGGSPSGGGGSPPGGGGSNPPPQQPPCTPVPAFPVCP
jgi:hypothetical protein